MDSFILCQIYSIVNHHLVLYCIVLFLQCGFTPRCNVWKLSELTFDSGWANLEFYYGISVNINRTSGSFFGHLLSHEAVIFDLFSISNFRTSFVKCLMTSFPLSILAWLWLCIINSHFIQMSSNLLLVVLTWVIRQKMYIISAHLLNFQKFHIVVKSLYQITLSVIDFNYSKISARYSACISYT